MKYQVIYESRTGNTAKVAKAIAASLPAGQTTLVNLAVQQPDYDADIYFVGFGVRHGVCPMGMLELLELLDGKTIFLFATCGMNPTPAYHDTLERGIEPFLPDNCDYRGLYLCQGAISEEGYAAIKRRFANNDGPETAQRLEEFRVGTQGHPDAEDLEQARAFAINAISTSFI